MKSFLFVFLFSLSLIAKADKLPGYYGADFIQKYEAHSLENDSLRQALFEVLSQAHVPQSNGMDKLTSHCDGEKGCYMHTALGYDGARHALFGSIYLQQTSRGYAVKDVYCQKTYTEAEMGKGSLGPHAIPSAEFLNVEHTWPQSRFTNRFPKELQKSDLHHLYPTDSHMNSSRSSLHFGDVTSDMEKLNCNTGKLGSDQAGEVVFEPPAEHKGHVARALFYFAVRYQMKMSADEVKALREWDHQYPVDEFEATRNEEIFQLQKDRNPFIDIPGLADHIQNF
jgi:endonuclease I